MFKRHLFSAVLVAGTVFAPAAHAAVELSSPQFAIFNFDFTPFPAGYMPKSMYVLANTGPTSYSPPTDAVRIELYAGVNGAGTLINACDFISCGVNQTDTGVDDILDGIFSAKLIAVSGNFTVNPSAVFSDGGDEITGDPTLTGKTLSLTGSLYRTNGTAVPLPGTLALLALGTAAIGLAPSRRNRERRVSGR